MNARRGFLALASTLAVSALVLFGGLQVSAADTPPPAKSVMTLAEQTKQNRDGSEYLVLTARLTKADGYSLSERTIYFYENNDVFGPAAIPIGSAVTSAAGIATLNYSTRLLGEHSVKAVFSGDNDAQAIQVEATFTLTSIPNLTPLTAPTGLEGVSHWALLSVGILVLIVWGTLLGILIGIRRGIAGRST